MRPLGVVLAVLVVIGALTGTVWLGRYSPLAEKHERVPMAWEAGTAEAQREIAKHEVMAKQAAKEDEKELERLAAKRPPIADKAPFPKAVTGERVYEFGSMSVNEEKKHLFRIENKGQAPLLIAKGPTNCKCTISNISKSTIEPGASADIEMSWTPRETTSTFAKTATIWTNDPDNSEIQFKIFGKVVKHFVVIPERNWHAGHITDVQDGQMTGYVASPVDTSFKITSIECADPHVKMVYKKMNAKACMREGAKSGYEFTTTVDKGIPPGHFRQQARIHTTLEGNKIIDVEVTATRSGPVLFLPPIGNSRAFWNAEKSLVNMGRFQHEVGAKVILPALVYGSKEKFQLLGVEKDAEFVRVSVEPNSEIGGGDQQQGVRFIFEVPAGAPPVTRITPNGVHVTLKTNHPKLKTMTFELEFVSQ